MKRLTRDQEERIINEIAFSHLENIEKQLRLFRGRDEKLATLASYFKNYPGDFIFSKAEKVLGDDIEDIRITKRAKQRIEHASLAKVKTIFRHIGETHYPLYYEYIRQKSQNK